MVIHFPERCFKRKNVSKRIDSRDLLEKADRKLFQACSVDPDCPLAVSKIIPKKKETNTILETELSIILK